MNSSVTPHSTQKNQNNASPGTARVSVTMTKIRKLIALTQYITKSVFGDKVIGEELMVVCIQIIVKTATSVNSCFCLHVSSKPTTRRNNIVKELRCSILRLWTRSPAIFPRSCIKAKPCSATNTATLMKLSHEGQVW